MVEHLSNDALALVLEKVAQQDGVPRGTIRLHLTLVCRRWAALVTACPALWNPARLAIHSALPTGGADGLAADMRRRAPLVRHLVVDFDQLYRGTGASGLRQLLAHVIREATALQRLDLLNLPETAWSDGILSACPPSLARISICTQTLAYLPQSITQLRGLAHLKFLLRPFNPACRLSASSLPALCALPALRSLVLYGVTQLPAALSVLSVTRLELGGSALLAPGALPEALGSLPALQHWRCSNCSLAAVPPFLSAIATLTHIAFLGCSIADEPTSFAALASLATLPLLQELSLAGCGLAAAAAHVAQLPHLSRLQLRDNLIRDLPPGPYLASLSALSLTGTALRQRDGLAGLQSCTALRRLELGGPQPFRTVPPGVLALVGLTALILSGMGLRQLPEGGYLRSLCILDLAYNEFSALPPALSATTALARLRLDDNCSIEAAGGAEGVIALLAPLCERGLRQLSLARCFGLLGCAAVVEAVGRLTQEWGVEEGYQDEEGERLRSLGW